MKSRRLLAVGVLLLVGALPARSVESTPNWTNRYRDVFQQLRAERVAPGAGTTVTVVRRIGGPVTGRIDDLGPAHVVLDGTRYEARQLVDDTCDRLFPDFYASRHARKQVLEERDTYLRQINEEARRAEQSRVEVSAYESPIAVTQDEESSSAEGASYSPPSMTGDHNADSTSPAASDPVRTATPPLSTEDMTIALVFGVMILTAVIIGGYKIAADASANSLRKRLADEADRAIDEIQRNGGLLPVASHLCLKPGENAFRSEPCSLSETRAVRSHSGMGMGFTIAKGVRVGLGSGTSVSVPTMTKIDSGTLVLTSTRLVFDGSHADRTIPLAKILSVKPYLDALEISIENRQKSMYFTVANPFVWAIWIRGLTSGELFESPQQRSEAMNDGE